MSVLTRAYPQLQQQQHSSVQLYNRVVYVISGKPICLVLLLNVLILTLRLRPLKIEAPNFQARKSSNPKNNSMSNVLEISFKNFFSLVLRFFFLLLHFCHVRVANLTLFLLLCSLVVLA